MPLFTVLCRIDAYADYIAVVAADDAEEAVTLARENHSDYRWEHEWTVEFDDRCYVALDKDSEQIEATRMNDFI